MFTIEIENEHVKRPKSIENRIYSILYVCNRGQYFIYYCFSSALKNLRIICEILKLFRHCAERVWTLRQLHCLKWSILKSRTYIWGEGFPNFRSISFAKISFRQLKWKKKKFRPFSRKFSTFRLKLNFFATFLQPIFAKFLPYFTIFFDKILRIFEFSLKLLFSINMKVTWGYLA